MDFSAVWTWLLRQHFQFLNCRLPDMLWNGPGIGNQHEDSLKVREYPLAAAYHNVARGHPVNRQELSILPIKFPGGIAHIMLVMDCQTHPRCRHRLLTKERVWDFYFLERKNRRGVCLPPEIQRQESYFTQFFHVASPEAHHRAEYCHLE